MKDRRNWMLSALRGKALNDINKTPKDKHPMVGLVRFIDTGNRMVVAKKQGEWEQEVNV